MLRNRMAKNYPTKWGKNNKLVNPLCLCVLPEMSSNVYPDSSLLRVDNQTETAVPTSSIVDRQSSPHIAMPSFLDSDEENLEHPIHFEIHLSGWAEVFNRVLNHPQLAYIVHMKCTLQGKQKNWTTFRTQKDFDEIFSTIPQGSISLPQHRGLELRSSEIVTQGDSEITSGNSPGTTKKLDLPKRITNFSTVSARHQCSPDQSVHLMSLRLKTLLGDQFLPVLEKLAEQSGETNSSSPEKLPNPSPQGVKGGNEAENSVQTPSEISIDPREALYESTEDFPQISISDLLQTRSIFFKSFSRRSALDVWFLQPPADGGIEKYLSPVVLKRAIQTAIVSRALWDTHWKEEIAVLYPTHMAFYSPMAKKASWTLSLQELIGISHIPDEKSPITGKSILKIETIGRVYYLAFPSKDSCNSLSAAILEHFSGVSFDTSLPSFVETTDPRDRFVLKSGRWKPVGRRLILNARKFSFDMDTPPLEEKYWEFSARLLKTVFQLDRNNRIRLSSEILKNGSTPRVTDSDNIDVSFETNADGLFPGR